MAMDVLDEPFADSSIIPTSLIYRAIRGKSKVVLSGEGGDELFGGYIRHRYLAPHARIFQRGIGDALFSLYGDSPAALSTRNPIVSRARWALERYTGDLVGAYLSSVRTIDFPIAVGKLRKDLTEAYKHRSGVLASPASLFFDRSLYLPYDLLYKTDMASMASSIESRVPFLDREVLAALGRIDPKFCLSPEYTDKLLLKKVAEKYLPSDLVFRPKKGFGFSHRTYQHERFDQDVEASIAFHAAHAADFGLESEALKDVLRPQNAALLADKYPAFAFALVTNRLIFAQAV
jgi:asparagine synthase (glutamine-hydrolysing)